MFHTEICLTYIVVLSTTTITLILVGTTNVATVCTVAIFRKGQNYEVMRYAPWADL